MVEKMEREVEAFDLVKYMDEGGWDAGKVCALTDQTAQGAIAAFVVSAALAAERGDEKDARRSADQALRILREEQEAGRTKQAERERRDAT